MPPRLEQALDRVRQWPAAQQDEAADLLLALDDLGPDPIEVDDDTLSALDAALADIDAGRHADPAEVRAIFQRHRK